MKSISRLVVSGCSFDGFNVGAFKPTIYSRDIR